MTELLLRCVYCSRGIDPTERHYPEYRGFGKPGKGLRGNSGSSLVLRERTGRAACVACITARLYGITTEQMTFEELGGDDAA